MSSPREGRQGARNGGQAEKAARGRGERAVLRPPGSGSGSSGTLDLLRKGIKDSGCKFKLAYFRPVSGLNPELQNLYQANQFTVIRQLHYSDKTEHSLDLGLFLNGRPIFTAEMKHPLKGQNVQDAIRQYRLDRNAKEPFFALGRCLAHFAVDPDLVYLATKLEGPKSRFLPFNQGRSGGAREPPFLEGICHCLPLGGYLEPGQRVGPHATLHPDGGCGG